MGFRPFPETSIATLLLKRLYYFRLFLRAPRRFFVGQVANRLTTCCRLVIGLPLYMTPKNCCVNASSEVGYALACPPPERSSPRAAPRHDGEGKLKHNATRFSKAPISGDIVPRSGPGNAGGLRRRFFSLLGSFLNRRDYPKEPAARPPALPGEDRRFEKNEWH
jgi:hypothetical protein